MRTDSTSGDWARWIPPLLWAMLAKGMMPLGVVRSSRWEDKGPQIPKGE